MVPGNPQQTNKTLSLRPKLNQQIQNISKFLIISPTNVDARRTAEFYILIHAYKSPTQVIAEDLLYEIAHKLVYQHKNTDWAVAPQFMLHLHMHNFF